MYANKMVAAIKVNGRVLRENKEVVMLPFGSEYNIFLKNMSTVRALVNVFIDGDDVTDGTGIIIHANSVLDLERSIRNGNFEKGNRFRFIERSEQIEENRGIGVEDGLIRIEYKFEKPVIYNYFMPYTQYTNSIPNYQTQMQGTWCNSNIQTNTVSFLAAQGSSNSCACGSVSNCVAEETGITVPGSESNQRFTQGYWFATEDQSSVIVLKLVGECDGCMIKRPVTVDRKPICVTCGKINSSIHSYCSQCGTALKVF